MTQFDHIEANAQYMSDESAAALEQIPAAMWDRVLAAFDEQVNGGEIGIDCEVAVTHETLADFDNSALNHWNEIDSSEAIESDGEKIGMAFHAVQLARGQRRHELVVVDCGEIRVVLTF